MGRTVFSNIQKILPRKSKGLKVPQKTSDKKSLPSERRFNKHRING
jgi:hypothetical protein